MTRFLGIWPLGKLKGLFRKGQQCNFPTLWQVKSITYRGDLWALGSSEFESPNWGLEGLGKMGT